MKPLFAVLLVVAALLCTGCFSAPGYPAAGPEVPRPSEVLEFETLYAKNCSGCHGDNGKDGAAIALANPVYLAVAGEKTVRQITAKGVPGKLMPGFQKDAGGTLTAQQVTILVHGIYRKWSTGVALDNAPAYSATLTGDPIEGQDSFHRFCSSCHKAEDDNSIASPIYLSLVSDQNLRSIVIAGLPDKRMPDWRALGMTDRQVTDIVAWLGAQRAKQS